jgi:site-specific recombinase XerD
VSRKKGSDPDRNLYQRGATYWCRYVLAGAERRISLRTSDVKIARRERDRLLGDVADARAGRVPEVVRRWEDAVEGFLAFQEGQVAARAISGKTARRYETSIVQLAPALEGQPLEAITTGTVLDFVLARREEGKAASTIKNDLTAWSRVMSFAATKVWITANPLRAFERATYVGRDADGLNPPTDDEVDQLIHQLSSWSIDMAMLTRWLRETGMRLAEALQIHVADIHPDRRTATLRRGVKRNTKDGLKTRTIDLGPKAAEMLLAMPEKGRLFGRLHIDSAVVSTRYGQWRRQRQGREDRAAEDDGRNREMLREFRLHDLRHAFAIASLIDDSTCVYRLKGHLGHGSVQTTEMYTRFLSGEGAQRRYLRRREMFGSLPADQGGVGRAAA